MSKSTSLPITTTIMQAYAAIRLHGESLLRSSIPFVLLVVLYYVLALLATAVIDLKYFYLNHIMTVNMLSSIVQYLVLALVSAWMLRALLQDSSTQQSRVYRLTLRECKFLIWAIVVAGIFLLLCIVPVLAVASVFSRFLLDTDSGQLTAAGWLVALLCVLPGLLQVSRVLPVFPALASGEDAHLQRILRLSKGNSARLALLLCFLPLTAQTLVLLLPGSDSIVYDLTASLFWLLLTVFELAILANCYQWLTIHSGGTTDVA